MNACALPQSQRSELQTGQESTAVRRDTSV
jgi:hypothetical protein